MKMITPTDILATRAEARCRGALAHTYNADGHIKREVGCSCYECRDYYDPYGVEDARRANEMAAAGGVGAPGYLPRADAIPATEWRQNPTQVVGARGYLARADGVRSDESPRINPLLPPPPPALRATPTSQLARADGIRPEDLPPLSAAPRLERQRAVCYDDNGVDILAAGQRVAAALRGRPQDVDRGSRFELGPEHAAVDPAPGTPLESLSGQELRDIWSDLTGRARGLRSSGRFKNKIRLIAEIRRLRALNQNQ